jgi:carboxypeptidase family protein
MVSMLLAWSSPIVTAQDVPQPAMDQVGTIHGVVLSTVDDKPITAALVTLMNSNRSMMTDEKGQFSFSAVPFGSESVAAKKPGFLCPYMRSPKAPHCFESVEVMSADIVVTLTMMPQAVITGRIVDQAGEPVADLNLSLGQRRIEDGLFVWGRVGQSVTKTNAEGAFRIANLAPGAFILRTSTMADPQSRSSGYDHGYATTYYPGTHELSAAKQIVIHAGEEFKADLKVTNEKFLPVSVSAAWNHEWPVGGCGCGVSSTAGDEYLNQEFDSSRNEIHSFVPPGGYNAQFTLYPPGSPPAWPDGTKQPYLGSAEFTVKDQPISLTEVPLQQPITIPVHIRAELAPQEGRKADVPSYDTNYTPAVYFNLLNGGAQINHEFRWRADRGPSNFDFKDIPPGRHVLQVSEINGFKRVYVASLTCGGIDLLREPLVVAPGTPACAIEAVIRDDNPTLTVGFTPQAIAQMTAANAKVTDLALIPLDSQGLPYSALVTRGLEPKTVTIAPGTYFAFLFDGRAIAWRDPDERKRLMTLGTVVTLASGRNKTVLLDWRPEINDGEATMVGLGRVLP